MCRGCGIPQPSHGGQRAGRSPVLRTVRVPQVLLLVSQALRNGAVAARQRVLSFTMMESTSARRVLIAPEGIDGRHGEKERLAWCR